MKANLMLDPIGVGLILLLLLGTIGPALARQQGVPSDARNAISSTGKNASAEGQLSSLPLELALKQVRGSGKNVMVTFEDPNCRYCKKLAKELLTLKDVTIYTFLVPLLGDDSYEKSKAIWCARDKSKVWVDWMTAGEPLPPIPPKCNITGLDRSAQLGSKLRIIGTPQIFFASGERVMGYVSADEISKRLGSPRDVSDAQSRASGQATQTAPTSNASSTSRAQSQQAGSQGGAELNRNRLFVVYSAELARPFVVTNESMLQTVLSDYLRILNSNRVNTLSASDFRTKECIAPAGTGSLFAFVQYQHENQSGSSMGWGVSCGQETADGAAQAAQRACEARSGYCNAPRASTYDRNSVQLIIGDIRVPGENRTMKEIKVQLSESRSDSGGRGVGDVINWDFYSNISSGFICDWFNGGWSNGSPEYKIYGNGQFFKSPALRLQGSEIAYRCSSFLRR